MRLSDHKVRTPGHTTHPFRPKMRSGSVADIAMQRIGKLLPIAKGSKIKARIIACTPNASGQSAWYLLENGIRVCVSYSNGLPFLWVTPPNVVKGTDYFAITSEDKSARPDADTTE